MANTQQYSEEDLDELTDALASQGTDEVRITEAADLDVTLAQVGGTAQSAVDVAAKIQALADALGSNGTDTLRTDLTDQQGRNLGKARLMDSGNTLIDPATEATLSALAAALASNANDSLLVDSNTALDASAATVPVEQQSPVGVEDSTGTQVDPAENVDGSSTSATTTSTGSASAASASVPDGRTAVTAAWDVSGSATVTVEVSPDGGTTWYQEYQASPGSAETNTYNFRTGFDDVRVYVNQNLNSASIGAKGA